MTYDGQPPTEKNKYLLKDIDYIKKRWNNRADRWDSDLSDPSCHLNRKNSYKRFIDILSQEIYDSAICNGKYGFLDLGCGTGELLKVFADHFCWSCGIDISPKMLEYAKNKSNDSTLLIEGDVFDPAVYPNGNIAVIAGRGVLLSHYGEKLAEQLLVILYNKLMPGGFIFLDAIQFNGINMPTEKKGYYDHELKELAENAGFSSVVVYREEEYPLLFLKASKNE